MEIYYSYVKLRKEFGRRPNFDDDQPQILADIRSDPHFREEFIERSPVVTNVQVTPEMSEHEVNTDRKQYSHRGMWHQEGGWPKDIDRTEVEHTIRYRKKVEKDEAYIASIARLGAEVETLVKQNNAIDIYEEYFAGPSRPTHEAEKPSAKITGVLRDPSKVPRGASFLSWCTEPGSDVSKLVCAYSVLEFQHQPAGMPLTSYIWDIHNSNAPLTALEPLSQMACAVYNPKDPHLIAAGLYNGQVGQWDTRAGGAAAESSRIEASHRDPVFDLVWLQSKTGTECATCSTDGALLWWDTRRLRDPVESMLCAEKGSEAVLGGVSLCYEAAAGPNKLMIGTEQGTVLSCNRKAKTPQDRVGVSYGGHTGPVYSVARNPFYPKFFLTVGDWTSRVWAEDLRAPVCVSRHHDTYLTGARWSPTRAAVYYTIKMDGTVDVWDLMVKQVDPVINVQVQSSGLCSLQVQEGGEIAGVGAAQGSVTILSICKGLHEAQPNEKQAVGQMLERETKREKNLESRAKELRQKAARGKAQVEKPYAENPRQLKNQEFEMLSSFKELTAEDHYSKALDMGRKPSLPPGERTPDTRSASFHH